tara:strand:- start:17 stop:610 length:594 start_codon:yes stop_codon:yes gene_type:complete
MKSFSKGFLILFSIQIAISCGGDPDSENNNMPTLDTAALVKIDLDTLLADSIVKDSVWCVFPPFGEVDSSLDSTTAVKKSLDSLYNDIAESVEAPLKSDSNKQIVGKWFVEKKVSGMEITQVQKKVFAVYHQDSIFSMKAINVLGKWWIVDTLLFQKYELPTKLTIDTSVINILNDSILEVEEIGGGDKFIFRKFQD